MKTRANSLALLIVICLTTVACGPGQIFGPTVTPTPTDTPTPTATLTPTPTITPTATLTPDPIAGWNDFTVPELAIRLKHPSEWLVYPAVDLSVGQAALITSDQTLASAQPNTEISYQPDEFYVWLSLETIQAISTASLAEWVKQRPMLDGRRVSVTAATIDNQPAVIEIVQCSSELSFETLYISYPSGVIALSGGPLESTKIGIWQLLLQTFKLDVPSEINYRLPTSYLTLIDASLTLWQSDSGYVLPFEGETSVTCGPGSCDTHKFGGTAEAIDFALAYGTLIYPTKPGKVIVARTGWNHGYGNYVRIQHDDETISYYGHLSEILVNSQQKINLSTPLGKAGNTGNVWPRPTPEKPLAGTHLHFQVNTSDGRPVSVQSLVNWKPGCPPCSDWVEGTAKGPSRASSVPQSASCATTVTVEGVVYNMATNSPASEITVKLYFGSVFGSPNYTTTSDVNGYFSFSNIPSGTYAINPLPPTGYIANGMMITVGCVNIANLLLTIIK